MITVDQLARGDVTKSQHNHETYKLLYQQCAKHVKLKHEAGCTEAFWVVPVFVVGRGVYDVNHAVRYICDKLKVGKFRVEVVSGTTLHIGWEDSLRKALKSAVKKQKHVVAMQPKQPKESLSESLERLRKSLGSSSSTVKISRKMSR